MTQALSDSVEVPEFDEMQRRVHVSIGIYGGWRCSPRDVK